MAHYSKVLVADSARVLVDALVEATAAANQEVRLLSLERSHWEEFVPQLRGEREGRRQWSDSHKGDTARVCLSWWTDPIGRRHCRLVAGNSRDGSYNQLSALAKDPHPPLWHVHPERMFFRQREGRDDWVVICACGVCGEPESIGWMGTHCAACHDRQEEGQPPAPILAPAGIFTHHAWERPILTFSPDSKWLVTVQAAALDLADVCLVEVATGRVCPLPSSAGPAPTLRDGPYVAAFSPDGRLLAYSEGPNRLLVRNLQTGVLELDAELPTSMFQAKFAPDGRTLATLSMEDTRLWLQSEEGVYEKVIRHETPGTAVAFAASGKRLAVVGEDQLVLFDILPDELVQVAAAERPNNRPARNLAFRDDDRELIFLASHDGTLTAMLGEMTQGLYYASEVFSYAIEPGGLVHKAQQELRGLGIADMSSDTRYVAAITRDGTHVWVADTQTNRPLVRLAWDLGQRLMRVALSPDDQVLAVVDNQGRGKFIPWRLLLDA